MGYVSGFYHWVWASIWPLVVGGFIGHLYGEKIEYYIGRIWRKFGG